MSGTLAKQRDTRPEPFSMEARWDCPSVPVLDVHLSWARAKLVGFRVDAEQRMIPPTSTAKHPKSHRTWNTHEKRDSTTLTSIRRGLSWQEARRAGKRDRRERITSASQSGRSWALGQLFLDYRLRGWPFLPGQVRTRSVTSPEPFQLPLAPPGPPSSRKILELQRDGPFVTSTTVGHCRKFGPAVQWLLNVRASELVSLSSLLSVS